jgi:hypothetical protein
VPENVSSKKPRARKRGVLPQTDIVAVSTSTRGGAVSHPSASIRKTCPATGVDPNLAGLLKKSCCRPDLYARESPHPARGAAWACPASRTVLLLVCTIDGAACLPSPETFPAPVPALVNNPTGHALSALPGRHFAAAKRHCISPPNRVGAT